MILFHYTCEHGRQGIERCNGRIRPNPSALFPLVWLTDLAIPEPLALGLTSTILDCDRTMYRFAVDTHAGNEIVRWPWWCRRRNIPRRTREILEAAPGARPMNWFVSERPVMGVPWSSLTPPGG